MAIVRKHAYFNQPGGSWKQVVLPGDGMTQVESITSSAPYMAVGCSNCTYDLLEEEAIMLAATRGAVWTSADGVTWELIDLGSGSHILKVAGDSRGYAALGRTCIPEPGPIPCRWDWAAWVSPDGREWTRVSFSSTYAAQINEIVVTDEGPLFLGYNDVDGSRVTWSSSDGANWLPSYSVFLRGGDHGYGEQAVAFKSGVVQVGAVWSETQGANYPVSWLYERGDWTSTPADGRLVPGSFNDVALVGGELVAVGSTETLGKPAPAAWHSMDGLNWLPLDVPAALAGEYLSSIEAIGPGLALVASTGRIWQLSLDVAVTPEPSPTTEPTPRPTPAPTPTAISGDGRPYVNPSCHAEIPPGWSVARYWDEKILELVRQSSPAPGVHARNLFHLAVAMWDAWAAYDDQAAGYFVREKHAATDVGFARDTSISYAAFGILKWRYYEIGGFDPASQGLENTLTALCYRPDYESTSDDNPAALGNRIAAAVIKAGRKDGARESDGYTDPSYTPLNEPIIVDNPGTVMAAPNHWQPIEFLTVPTDQSGRPLGSPLQKFVGAGWGFVRPFAQPSSAKGVPIDPGPPPLLGDDSSDAELKDELVALIRYSAALDISDRVMIDIGPGALGDNPLGTMDGVGHDLNPATGQPYEPHLVLRADFQRAIAEFWADGPNSETPPGHWNVVANAMADAPGFTFQVGGAGPSLDRLEWDVKMYLALNGAVHDAAIAAWGLKRHYDSARPISLIRYMAGQGQSSDPAQPAYDPEGLLLVPDLIEIITAESSAAGQRHEHLADHIGEVAVRSWRGFPANTFNQVSGVGWMLGIDWVPYQRTSFVTPAFPGYVSGHSTFSRAAAEVLTAMTGTEFFPGGLQTWTTHIGDLRHELGPSADITLQWATYYDAADLAGISRQYMGIHIAADDLTGRRVGSEVGLAAWDLATTYFDGSARD